MKILPIIFLSLVSTSALGFGGAGGGSHSQRVPQAYANGVNAIGIHIGGQGQADIKFKCDDLNSSPDEYGVCQCNDGYVEDSSGTCVLDQCTDFTPTDCITACDPTTGDKTYATLCHNDEYYCNASHECVNPCDEEQYDTQCQTCTPQGESAHIDNISGTCGEGGNYTCQAGACTDPCTIGEHDVCISWKAQNGSCVEDSFSPKRTVCDTHKICYGNGVCDYGCPGENEIYLDYNKECTAVDTTNLQCLSNADCLSTEFCAITSYSNYIPTQSACQSHASRPKQVDVDVLNPSGVGSKRMIRSKNTMLWDAAYNWCLSFGGRMTSLTDFGMTHCDTTGKELNKCASANVYVCTQNSCTSPSDYQAWKLDETHGYYSELSSDIKSNWAQLGTGACWMNEGWNNNQMYLFNPSNGALTNGNRYNGYFALCVIE